MLFSGGVMKNKKINKKGFTLIEILVAVIIIGVLAAIALPSYMRSMEKSKAANPIANLSTIARAQKAYKFGTNHYTSNVSNLDVSLKNEPNGEDATGSTFESENFTYKVYGDDKAAATATRKNVSEDDRYELSVDYDTNKIYCRPAQNRTCIDLNLEEGQDYNSQEDDGDWQNCLDNISGLASMVGMEGYEAELEAMVNEYYSQYCKIRGEEYKICASDGGDYFCLRGKYDSSGCAVEEFCLSSGSNLGECQGEKEYGSDCYTDLGNYTSLEKTCDDLNEETLECNSWSNHRLSYWPSGWSYWDCEDEGIAPDGQSCLVYKDYRITEFIDGQQYDFINCGAWHHGDGVIISECDIREYSDDMSYQTVSASCYGDNYTDRYGKAPGTFNSSHTGCDSYAYYYTYAQGAYGMYMPLQCENGTCLVTTEDWQQHTCVANAQGNGCAE